MKFVARAPVDKLRHKLLVLKVDAMRFKESMLPFDPQTFFELLTRRLFTNLVRYCIKEFLSNKFISALDPLKSHKDEIFYGFNT